MIKALVTYEGVSYYSQNRVLTSPKNAKETSDAHDKRCWKERCHVDDKGILFIPPMAFKHALSSAAKYNPTQIAGRGKSTYTKHFQSGVLVIEPVKLQVHIDDVFGEDVFVPSDGKAGSGSRVWKRFPRLSPGEWDGVVEFIVIDEQITESVFVKTIQEAGSFIGVGRFRPQNSGYYGRFNVKKVEWTKC